MTIQLNYFVRCIDNIGYSAALEIGKMYQVVHDADAGSHHFLRVIDESGEDYLYPESCFIPLDSPQSIH